MREMCRFVISILVLSSAAAAPVQTAAVTEMLDLFQALRTSQYYYWKHVGCYLRPVHGAREGTQRGRPTARRALQSMWIPFSAFSHQLTRHGTAKRVLVRGGILPGGPTNRRCGSRRFSGGAARRHPLPGDHHWPHRVFAWGIVADSERTVISPAGAESYPPGSRATAAPLRPRSSPRPTPSRTAWRASRYNTFRPAGREDISRGMAAADRRTDRACRSGNCSKYEPTRTAHSHSAA